MARVWTLRHKKLKLVSLISSINLELNVVTVYFTLT
jgi:hypothetical protein